MYKFLIGIAVSIIGLSSFGQMDYLDEAVFWLHSGGYTVFNTTKDYQPTNYLRRDEAAKILTKIAKSLGVTTYKKSFDECKFIDLQKGHSALENEIIESCRLGIFQGYGDKFMPDRAIPQELFETILIRTFDAASDTLISFLGTCGANKYQTILQTPLFPDRNITRGLMAELTYDIHQWALGSGKSDWDFDNCYGI